MSVIPVLTQFINQLSAALQADQFIKISLGNYKGAEPGLRQIQVRQVLIKRTPMLSFTYRYKTKDIVKNYAEGEALALLASHIGEGFLIATLFTHAQDMILQANSTGTYSLRTTKASLQPAIHTSHDHQKQREIKAAGQHYLTALKITDAAGHVFPNAQDKFKQINQYIALLSPMLKDMGAVQPIQVADMGSGKGYLTFALYDYMNNVLKQELAVTGVEFRKDLVDLCNTIARQSGFKGLSFVEGSIADYSVPEIDLLIALHACDTATDDAIAKGIQAGAELIVVAPCCHKQIRKEMDKSKIHHELDFILKYGVFMERQAEMATDGIRSLILEYFGYKTKVVEFISDQHTPKNVLLIGVKKGNSAPDKLALINQLRSVKAYLGIGYHHLERLMGLET